MTPKPRRITGYLETSNGHLAQLACGHNVKPSETAHIRQRCWRCEQPEFATHADRAAYLARLDVARKRIGVGP